MNFEKYETEFDGRFFCIKELPEDSSEEKSEDIPDAKVLENAQKEFEVTLVNLRKAAHKVADLQYKWDRKKHDSIKLEQEYSLAVHSYALFKRRVRELKEIIQVMWPDSYEDCLLWLERPLPGEVLAAQEWKERRLKRYAEVEAEQWPSAGNTAIILPQSGN